LSRFIDFELFYMLARSDVFEILLTREALDVHIMQNNPLYRIRSTSGDSPVRQHAMRTMTLISLTACLPLDVPRAWPLRLD